MSIEFNHHSVINLNRERNNLGHQVNHHVIVFGRLVYEDFHFQNFCNYYFVVWKCIEFKGTKSFSFIVKIEKKRKTYIFSLLKL